MTHGSFQMTDIRIETSRKIIHLKRVFAHSSIYQDIQERFVRLFEQRKAQLLAGVSQEARGIALIGASGSGKTTTIARMLSQTNGLKVNELDTGETDIVSLQVPSPATLKFVGITALEALGYPLKRDKTAMVVWGQVREHLRLRKTLFMHLDEAQDLLRNQTTKELDSVVRTLKSLMQTKDWPVSIILSGMPELKELLNHDEQLARRFYPFEFQRLHPIADSARMLEMIKSGLVTF